MFADGINVPTDNLWGEVRTGFACGSKRDQLFRQVYAELLAIALFLHH
jgi:hypothetical protein